MAGPEASGRWGPRWAVASAAEGNGAEFCSPHIWARGAFPRSGMVSPSPMSLARLCPLPCTPSPHSPASFFLLNPLIKLGWALPCLKLPHQGRPADKWVIGEGQLGCPGPQRVTPGWLAAHPQHLLLPRARPAGDSRSFPAAQRVAGPRPPVGIRAMLSRSRSPHRCPARARPAQTGRLYLPRPPLESWHRLADGKNLPAGYVTAHHPVPGFPGRLPATTEGEWWTLAREGTAEGHSSKGSK